MLNTFAQDLERVCRELLLEEKWIVAPSLRVGHQWLDTLTLNNVPVVNARIKTLKGMALDLAGPEMARRGMSLISDIGATILVDRIVTRLRSRSSSYLGSLSSSPALARTMAAAIKSLRLAGIRAEDMDPASFEAPRKGSEIALILETFIDTLRTKRVVDYPEVLRMAIDLASATFKDNHPPTCVLLPEDMDLKGAEKELIEALPREMLIRLGVDTFQRASAGTRTASTAYDEARRGDASPPDASLLQWVPCPAEAPEAAGDGSASIFHAVGERNEVREALRRIMASGNPLDEVEVLHTDREVYVPLVYETLMQVLQDPKFDDASLPVTFAEGIPAIYSRPGRALKAWMEWMRDDFRQDTLAKMIEDGILGMPGTGNAFPFSRLAAILRATPIGMGRDSYLTKLETAAAETAEDGAVPSSAGHDRYSDSASREDTGQETEEGGQMLLDLLKILVQVSPEPGAGPGDLLQAAERFVEDVARKANELDNYAAVALLDQIRETARWVGDDSEPLSLDVAELLTSLPKRVRIGGSGPRPGCLHVDHLLSGGHSGRRVTFIIGLDDGRFPGAGLNDPLLLDHEREQLSPELPKASADLTMKLEGFARLCARLRGNVTLGFSSLDLLEDRPSFPSSVVFSAYRILSNNREGDQGDMIRWLASPGSFAPHVSGECIDGTEWWLSELCGRGDSGSQNLVLHSYPHLQRGARAAQKRASDLFTVFDGLLPDLPEDLNPFTAAGPVMSATSLETIGRCPLAYFFRYVLDIAPPDEVLMDPSRWLDPLQFGNLMHEVFYHFLCDLIDRDLRPHFERDKLRLLGLLWEHCERYAKQYPPPGPSAFRRQVLMLIHAAVVFLVEEELLCRQSRPMFLEASIGVKPYLRGSDLDMRQPLGIDLPGGTSIRARARIDRVDRVGDEPDPLFTIWDYKSGGNTRYEGPDPFRQGRSVQHALYLELASRALKKRVGESSEVSFFGYFFPGRRSRGVRIRRSPQHRETALEIMENLCRTVANGCFLATNNATEDCSFCDYTLICGDVEAVAAASTRKLASPENKNLRSIRELRAVDA